MEPTLQLMQVNRLIRTAVRLVKGMELRQAGNAFEIIVLSGILWFKARFICIPTWHQIAVALSVCALAVLVVLLCLRSLKSNFDTLMLRSRLQSIIPLQGK